MKYYSFILNTIIFLILIIHLSGAAFSKHINENEKFVETLKSIEPVKFCGTRNDQWKNSCVWLYPLGFSKSNAFAQVWSMSGERNCSTNFGIFDFVTSKNLFMNEICGEDFTSSARKDDIVKLKGIGQINAVSILEILKKHQIDTTTPVKLQSFPLKWKSDKFDVKYFVVGKQPSEYLADYKITIQFHSKLKGIKKLLDLTAFAGARECCDVIGYFRKSENPNIIILIGTKSNNEGLMEGDFMTINTSLKEGFSKPK